MTKTSAAETPTSSSHDVCSSIDNLDNYYTRTVYYNYIYIYSSRRSVLFMTRTPTQTCSIQHSGNGESVCV